jgi:hypothetical protein
MRASKLLEMTAMDLLYPILVVFRCLITNVSRGILSRIFRLILRAGASRFLLARLIMLLLFLGHSSDRLRSVNYFSVRFIGHLHNRAFIILYFCCGDNFRRVHLIIFVGDFARVSEFRFGLRGIMLELFKVQLILLLLVFLIVAISFVVSALVLLKALRIVLPQIASTFLSAIIMIFATSALFETTFASFLILLLFLLLCSIVFLLSLFLLLIVLFSLDVTIFNEDFCRFL